MIRFIIFLLKELIAPLKFSSLSKFILINIPVYLLLGICIIFLVRKYKMAFFAKKVRYECNKLEKIKKFKEENRINIDYINKLQHVPRNTTFKGDDLSHYNFLKNEMRNSIDYVIEAIKIDDVCFCNIKNNIGEYLDKFLKALESVVFDVEIANKQITGLNIRDISNIREITGTAYSNICLMIRDARYYLNIINDEFKGYLLDYNICKKGIIGENTVYNEVKFYKNRYHILSNVRVDYQCKFAGSDLIIISEKGIFVVDVKNYGKENETIEIDEECNWFIKSSKSKGQKEQKKAIEQNKYNYNIIKKVLCEELTKRGFGNIDYINFVSIICIANKNVNIINKSNEVIVRTSNIIPSIKNYKTEANLNQHIQTEIEKILKEKSLEAKCYPVDSRFNRIKTASDNLGMILSNCRNVLRVHEEYIKIKKKGEV